MDETVDKLIAFEVKQCRDALKRLAAWLSDYERQPHLSSDEFWRRFRAGDLGDEMDLVKWSIFWDMRQATEKRLTYLVK